MRAKSRRAAQRGNLRHLQPLISAGIDAREGFQRPSSRSVRCRDTVWALRTRRPNDATLSPFCHKRPAHRGAGRFDAIAGASVAMMACGSLKTRPQPPDAVTRRLTTVQVDQEVDD